MLRGSVQWVACVTSAVGTVVVVSACVGADPDTTGSPTDAGAGGDTTAPDGGAPTDANDGAASCTPLARRKLPHVGSVVYKPSGLALIYGQDDGLFFQALDPSGSPTSNPVKVTQSVDDGGNNAVKIHSVGKSSEGFAALWSGVAPQPPGFGLEGGKLYLTAINANGTLRRETYVGLHSGSGIASPKLVASYAAEWTEQSDGISFMRFNETAEPIGTRIRVAPDPAGGPAFHATIAAAGTSGFAFAWRDRRDDAGLGGDIYFARLDNAGVKATSDVRITTSGNAAPGKPSLVWNDTSFGMAWTDARHGNPEIFFVRITTTGTIEGSELRLTDDPSGAQGADLTWTGSEYGVVWSDARDAVMRGYLARVSNGGVRVGADIPLTPGPEGGQVRSVTWTGSSYLVTGVEKNGGVDEGFIVGVCP